MLFLNDTNLNETFSRDELDIDQWTSGTFLWIFFHILYGLIGLVGLIGNFLVIYVILRFYQLKTVTNSFILSLAIADELYLIGIPVLIGAVHLNEWPSAQFLCKLVHSAKFMGQIASSFFVIIIAADRYFVICHPLKSFKWRTPLLAKMVSFVTWFLAGVVVLPVFVYESTINLGEVDSALFWPESSLVGGAFTWYLIYFLSFGFTVPFVLIASFYILILRKLKEMERSNERSPHRGQSHRGAVTVEFSANNNKTLSHKKVTTLVLSLVTVYFVCWFPFWMVQVEILFTPSERHYTTHGVILLLITASLTYANSAINPFLYAFISDDFKNSFLTVSTCGRSRVMNVPRKKSNLDDEEDSYVSSHELKPLDSIHLAGIDNRAI